MRRTTKQNRLYCCGCEKHIDARLTTGKEIYSHRIDLAELPFYVCDGCGNYVGCNHKSDNPTRPLGNIPTLKLRDARMHIHKLIDPIWKSKYMSRNELYKVMSKDLGYQYHTAEIRTIEEARRVYRVAYKYSKMMENDTTTKS